MLATNEVRWTRVKRWDGVVGYKLETGLMTWEQWHSLNRLFDRWCVPYSTEHGDMETHLVEGIKLTKQWVPAEIRMHIEEILSD